MERSARTGSERNPEPSHAPEGHAAVKNDTVNGGRGNDRIEAKDGEKDFINRGGARKTSPSSTAVSKASATSRSKTRQSARPRSRNAAACVMARAPNPG